MTAPARAERLALCDLAVEVGPDAPTLCDPWTVAELLAHLVLRERRPDLAGGIWFSPLAGRLEDKQAEVAQGDFAELVDRVRSGPPAWSPARIAKVDELTNLLEFFVHHEDVRRAADRAPRTAYGPVGPALDAALKRTGHMLFRRAEVGVTLVATGKQPFVAKPPTDQGMVTLTGAAPELLLVGFGRQRVARVEYAGPPEAVALLRGSSLGLA